MVDLKATSSANTRLKGNLLVWIALISILVFRTLVAFNSGLVPDEAYYWDWTRLLSTGYFDHPPMVAWMAWLTTSVFGHTVIGVRLVPLLCYFGCAVFSCMLASRYCKSNSSLVLLAILLGGMLLFAVQSLLLTPDAPLVFFWAMGLWAAHEALYGAGKPVWLVLGVVAGLGLVSKYIFVLFFGAIGLQMLLDKSVRQWLFTPWPYLMGVIAFAVFLPTLLWNAQNDWISFVFQLNHGLGGKSGARFDLFFEYLAGQLGIATPLLFAVMMVAVVAAIRQRRNNPRLAFLVYAFMVPFAFFAVSSLSKRVEANWPAPAYIAGCILVAWYWDRLVGTGAVRMRRFVIAATIVCLMFSVPIVVHVAVPFLPVPTRLDMTSQSRGWAEFGAKVSEVRERVDPEGTMPLCANRYQLTSLLGFYVEGHPRTWALNIASRPNHYSLLEARRVVYEGPVLFVHHLTEGDLSPVHADFFEYLEKVDTVTLVQGRENTREYGVFIGRIRKYKESL